MIERLQVQIPEGVVGEFSSPGSRFCADPYFSICSAPVLLQLKDPSHAAKSAGGRLQLQLITYIYIYTLRGWRLRQGHCKLVHGCMVYTEL